MPSLDLKLLLDFNSLVPNSALGAKAFSFATNNELFRSLPIFVSLVVLWFTGADKQRRPHMIVGLLAVALALGISVSVQSRNGLHLHPSIDPALSLKGKIFGILPETYGRDRSFPSDTATFFFGLSAVILLEHRLLGVVAILWSSVTFGVMRIALGWHYPSDVAAGIALGVGMVLLASKSARLIAWAQRLLIRAEPRMYFVHAAYFLFLAEGYSVFPGVDGILRGMKMVHVAVLK